MFSFCCFETGLTIASAGLELSHVVQAGFKLLAVFLIQFNKFLDYTSMIYHIWFKMIIDNSVRLKINL